MSGGAPGKPAYLWLWYADGKAAPEDNQFCSEIPPAFVCNFGSGMEGARVDDCKQQVQALLDDWYKDFNLLFTLTRPPSDFYLVIITSGWAKCQNELPPLETGMDPSMEAGIAPGNGCLDNLGQTALAIECGSNAHECANIIAHEHGHLVGLQHTASRADVMYPTILTSASAAGFDNNSNTIVDDQCNLPLPKQNSYQQMLTTLGTWPGGTKPSPFAAVRDASAPDLPTADSGDTASASGSVGPTPTGNDVDGGVSIVPGFDAPGLARPSLPTVDPAVAGTSGSHGGCNLTQTPTSPLAAAVVLLLGLALLARREGLRWAAARARGASSRRP